jgi:hypothetical protein
LGARLEGWATGARLSFETRGIGHNTLPGHLPFLLGAWNSAGPFPVKRFLWLAGMHVSSHRVRHRVEAVDDDVALGFVDAHGHGEAAVVELLVENFRVAMQPADAGAVGGVDG